MVSPKFRVGIGVVDPIGPPGGGGTMTTPAITGGVSGTF
jgi:hypothetical protein